MNLYSHLFSSQTGQPDHLASLSESRSDEASVTQVVEPWTRRAWLTRTSTVLLAVVQPTLPLRAVGAVGSSRSRAPAAVASRVAAQAERCEPAALEALAKQAVDAARAAGARYADARLTREVQHHYDWGIDDQIWVGNLSGDVETLGLGVRVMVDGYWGFSASPLWAPEEAVRLARDAVAQARVNAKGTPRTVDLGHYPVVTGTWATPVTMDPFTIPIEEKRDIMAYWADCAHRVGLIIDSLTSYLHFARQERVVATSDGSCVTQTLYESGGVITLIQPSWTDHLGVDVTGINVCGRGWELFLDAKIPEQLPPMSAAIDAKRALLRAARPAAVGRYTLVCDGATTASLVEQTLGLATQLDRALGYEANASGTSYLDDPLGMLGQLHVATPVVTVTANRSVPTQLATAQWDEEGVVPQECTLVKDGVLVDFQTTREQAAWLAPYYAKRGEPVRSHGHAAAEDALAITMQHMPNLALAPGASIAHLDDLVANVTNGIMISDGVAETDHQARNGTVQGTMRKISNGRFGPILAGGAVQFNTMDLWHNVLSLGGPATQGVIATGMNYDQKIRNKLGFGAGKGQPPQLTSHSVTGVAAIIANQPVIDIRRKA